VPIGIPILCWLPSKAIKILAHVLPGTGVIDFRAVVAELKRQRFNGYAQVECEHNMDNNLPDVIGSIRYFIGLSMAK
jgi:sugar phosphate isomerase/epimerase